MRVRGLLQLIVAATFLAVLGPAVAQTQTPGIDCGCTKTGPYVLPLKGKTVNVSTEGMSPRGIYQVEASTVGVPPGLAEVTVRRVSDDQVVVTAVGAHWGFSPDDHRFVVHYLQNGVLNVFLFDLQSGSTTPVRTFSDLPVEARLAFSPSGRYFLYARTHAHGIGLETTSLTLVDATTGITRHETSFIPRSAPGYDGDKFGSANWGFSPDGRRFVYSYVTHAGSPRSFEWNLVNLDAGRLVRSVSVGDSTAFWTFSPCGDVIALVDQPNQTTMNARLFKTADGSPIWSPHQTFAVADIAFRSTTVSHIATVNGVEYDLAPNVAAETCSGGNPPGNSAPTAGFTAPATLRPGISATFRDTSTDSDGTVTAWHWDFGDGATSAERSPAHAYAAAATYSVSLQVTDDDGGTDTVVKRVTVAEAPNLAPSADFDAPAGLLAGVPATFADTSTDSDGTIESWGWLFGDGETSQEQNPSHAYASAGTYSVAHVVSDDAGASDLIVKTVVVAPNEPPKASFSYSPTEPERRQVVRFEDTSTDGDDGIVSRTWSIGGGSNDQSVETMLCEDVEVSLTVFDSAGQSDTATKTVTVSQAAGSIVNVPSGGDLAAAADASCPGDTLVLEGGTYDGGIVLRDRGLKGSGAGESIITGFGTSEAGWVLETQGADVTVEDVTIQDGGVPTGGGGVLANTQGATRLLDIEVARNGGLGGVHIKSGVPTAEIRDSFIHHNTNSSTSHAGGGISMFCCAELVVIDNEISHNSAVGNGGGVALEEASFRFVGNYVHDNVSQGSGGGLSVAIASASVLNNRFVRNSAHSGGGGVAVRRGVTLLAGNLIADNSGGGLLRSGDSGELDVVNSTIAGNEGAGLTDQTDPTLTTSASVFNTIVTGNTPDVVGMLSPTSDNLIGVAAGFIGGGDYHLAAGSPAVDAGDDSRVPADLREDADGDARLFDGDGDGTATVDIGYDETTSVASDATPPSVTATPERAPDHGDWYNAPVTVTFMATDSGSGVASCDAPVTYSGPDSASASVTGTCTDNSGNVGAATFDLKFDDGPPTLTAPADVTVGNDPGTASALVLDAALGPATATDDGSAVTIARSGVPSENIFPLGPTRITYTATDAAGNSASATQLVTVIDDEPPILTAPANVTVDTDPGTESSVVSNAALGTATASDNAGPVTIVRSGVPTGNVFPLGVTTISYIATDAVGNQTTATQTVTVTVTAHDFQAPAIVVPSNTVVNATSPAGAVVTYAASATDNADPNPVVSCMPASGSTFVIGLTTVRCTATDASANRSEASFTVTVKPPAEQIVDLIKKTLAFMSLTPLEASLQAQLEATAAALVANRPRIVCKLLIEYIAAVKAAPAQAGLTGAEKAELVEDATRIRRVVACG